MKVELLSITPIKVGDIAIGTCWAKQRPTDVVDFERMDRVANKFKHESTIEHIVANLYIDGVSRLLLQELARHRMASLSVKSTRYTLKELKHEKPFCRYAVNDDGGLRILVESDDAERAKKYIVLLADPDLPTEDKIWKIDLRSIAALDQLRLSVSECNDIDKAKYNLPECYKTELTWSINMRSLKNFLKLRTDIAAHFEIRKLAYDVYAALPEEYKFLVNSEMTSYRGVCLGDKHEQDRI